MALPALVSEIANAAQSLVAVAARLRDPELDLAVRRIVAALRSLQPRRLLIVMMVLAATVASAQTRTWTNADLGRPMNQWQPAQSPSPATLQGLRERQTIPPADLAPGASVLITNRASDGPFGSFRFPPLPDQRRWHTGIPFGYPYGPIYAPPVRVTTGVTTPRPAARSRSRVTNW